MTRDEFNGFLGKLVAENIQANSKVIEDLIISAFSASHSPAEIQTRLAAKAISFSVEFSTKLVFEILNQLDVLPFEGLELRNVKPDLRIVPPIPQE